MVATPAHYIGDTERAMANTIRRALISVSDKRGIVELGHALTELGVEILSTGGTAKVLADAGVPVKQVTAHTGFPEIMAGRVKTLHPKIHGGLLGRRGTDDAVMATHNIAPIDMVVVNLYPFEETIANPNTDLATAIENIDIGGPAMLRSAAKNYTDVAVIVDVDDYEPIVDELKAKSGALSDTRRFLLARKAFAHTSRYDNTIANFLGYVEPGLPSTESTAPFPQTLTPRFVKSMDMRYGENPHQRAAFYVEPCPSTSSISASTLLQGRALSYNNVADADAALECVKLFPDNPACVIVKHANPCGVAQAQTLTDAYDSAFRTDPTSAFGGIIAFNRTLDRTLAETILERQFVEVIISPSVSDDALPVLAEKPNIRVLTAGISDDCAVDTFDFKRVNGGILVQDRDLGQLTRHDLRVVTKRQPTEREFDDLEFAWKVVKHVKSNAIVYCRDGATIGVGAGQMSRVYSARIASIKAIDQGLDIRHSVMASDAFFPFRDGLDAAAEVGVTAVIQPGGSMRDNEVIAAADEHQITMVFTGMRHFKH